MAALPRYEHRLGPRDLSPSSDPNFVAPGAIPWLKLQVVGAQDGPTGGHKLIGDHVYPAAEHLWRVAPSTGCAVSTDVGKKALVPYTADYFFYRFPEHDHDDGH